MALRKIVGIALHRATDHRPFLPRNPLLLLKRTGKKKGGKPILKRQVKAPLVNLERKRNFANINRQKSKKNNALLTLVIDKAFAIASRTRPGEKDGLLIKCALFSKKRSSVLSR
jgi:hypothetical protein